MKHIVLALLTAGFLAGLLLTSRSDEQTPSVDVAPAPQLSGAIQPRISPDGETIVFSRQGAIWKVPRIGGVATRLSSGSGYDVEPVWCFNGSRIAFINSPSMGGGTLKVLDANTGTILPWLKSVQVAASPFYGKLEAHRDVKHNRILGTFRQEGRNYGLSWFDLNTGEITSLVPAASRSLRYALSPDGDWVAYVTSQDVVGQQSGNNGPQADVWRVSSEGGTPEKLFQFPTRIHDLCFSADGSELIVANEFGSPYYDLWSIPLSNPEQGARQITFGQADEHRPSISRDGRWMVYTNNQQGPTSLVVRDLKTLEDQMVPITRYDFRGPTGSLRLATIDAKSSHPVTVRVVLQDSAGKYYAPEQSLYRVLNSTGHFYCANQCELQLPAGEYRLIAYRGPEYRPARTKLTIEAGKSTELSVSLERWYHAAEQGWYSGENHIHANYGYGEWFNSPASMLRQCAGENLNVCNFMVANSDTDNVFDRRYFRGGLDPLSTDETLLYWNQEFRSTIWGHMTLVNLKQVVEPVFTGFKSTTNPWDIPTNSDVADRAHLQNGLVNYTHVAQNPEDPYVNPYTGKGIPIDTALGKIDSLDLNNSYRGTTTLWYRLLNCGFRLSASAGTDCFLNRIRSRLPGGDRVYVQIGGPLDYSRWIEGLRAGRSFVTNGPMIEVFTVDGKTMGETVTLDAQREVSVHAVVQSQFPMSSVEVVYNGEVVARANLSNDNLRGEIDTEIPVGESGWLAFRATGPGHSDHPLGSQDAHTSPIYVQVADRPAGARDDAEYFLGWIDRLWLAIRQRDRIPGDTMRKHVELQMESARDVYRTIAEKAVR